jgi:hypothetical protein
MGQALLDAPEVGTGKIYTVLRMMCKHEGEAMGLVKTMPWARPSSTVLASLPRAGNRENIYRYRYTVNL